MNLQQRRSLNPDRNLGLFHFVGFIPPFDVSTDFCFLTISHRSSLARKQSQEAQPELEKPRGRSSRTRILREDQDYS
jgi:hypothetical protein